MRFSKYIRRSIVQFASLFYSSRKSKVIFYHDLHSDHVYSDMSTHIDLFRKHINIIRDLNYEIVSEITKSKGQIQICFDDGFSGIYDNIEVIKELQIYVTLFVITNSIDKAGFLSKNQLIDLSLFPYINIQSHTHTHSRLNSVNEHKLQWELEYSKKILEKMLNIKIDSLCFPEGRYNDKVIATASKCGYNKLYSSLPGFYYISYMDKIINRSLVQSANEDEFISILKGGDNILYYWYKLKHKRR